MSVIKAIHIDATARTIKEVDTDGTLADWYRLIGCEMVESIRPNGLAAGDILLVDEEGLLRDQACADWFIWKGYPQALAGNGLVAGVDEEGETVSMRTTLATVRRHVRFVSLADLKHNTGEV